MERLAASHAVTAAHLAALARVHAALDDMHGFEPEPPDDEYDAYCNWADEASKEYDSLLDCGGE